MSGHPSIMEDDLNIPNEITFKVSVVPAGIAKKKTSSWPSILVQQNVG